MRKLLYAMVIMVLALTAPSADAEELLLHPEKIIPTRSGLIPQAPRVSPDKQQLVFEYYSKARVQLWHATVNGTNAHCLTCSGEFSAMNLENGYWHPTGRYLVFNQVPEGNVKLNEIFTAAIQNGQLGKSFKVASGARPQFSRPNGHVIFFETSEIVDGRRNNILAYQIIGPNPLEISENMRIELRGPIQQVNQNSELSHPSLAPDGTTIVFAARSGNIEGGGDLVLNDTDRQKIYKLWKGLNLISRGRINEELSKFSSYLSHDYHDNLPAIGNHDLITIDDFSNVLEKGKDFAAQQTIVQGFTKRHLFIAWVLGLLDKLGDQYDDEVQQMIYPRLWVTDVFGAPIEPLVKDLLSTALPQKWPTVSHDGKFVVFEAGHYSDRHIYLVAKKGNEWKERAVKMTESGTYNSSPEVDSSGQWLYFESNRDGTKGIWRAKLNWPEINKRLGL